MFHELKEYGSEESRGRVRMEAGEVNRGRTLGVLVIQGSEALETSNNGNP